MKRNNNSNYLDLFKTNLIFLGDMLTPRLVCTIVKLRVWPCVLITFVVGPLVLHRGNTHATLYMYRGVHKRSSLQECSHKQNRFFVITICPNVMKKYFNTMKISKLLKLLKIFAFSVVNVNDEYMKPWFKRRCRS